MSRQEKKDPNQTQRINPWMVLTLRLICKYRDVVGTLENVVSNKVFFSITETNPAIQPINELQEEKNRIVVDYLAR